MKSLPMWAVLLVFGLILGCSTETAKRLTYESLQARQQLECQKTPGQECPGRDVYDSYQQKRDEINRGD